MKTAIDAVQGADNSLSRRDFNRLAAFINDYSGIKMPDNKQTMLEGRLRRRLRATGHASFADYCGYLFEGDGLESEAVFLIDAVTTNKTDFFREPKHFARMTATVLPDLRRRDHRNRLDCLLGVRSDASHFWFLGG